MCNHVALAFIMPIPVALFVALGSVSDCLTRVALVSDLQNGRHYRY